MFCQGERILHIRIAITAVRGLEKGWGEGGGGISTKYKDL